MIEFSGCVTACICDLCTCQSYCRRMLLLRICQACNSQRIALMRESVICVLLLSISVCIVTITTSPTDVCCDAGVCWRWRCSTFRGSGTVPDGGEDGVVSCEHQHRIGAHITLAGICGHTSNHPVAEHISIREPASIYNHPCRLTCRHTGNGDRTQH
jgi:hypothetical protein